MSKTLLFGGSFNPPHNGHVYALSQASMVGFSQIWVFPAYQHPYNKRLVSFEDRFAMCVAAFGHMENVQITDVEKVLTVELNRQIYTYDVVQKLKQSGDIYLLLGWDALEDLPKWHNYDQLIKEMTPFPIKRSSISSTMIRENLSENHKLLPPAVWQYIQEKQLYETFV